MNIKKSDTMKFLEKLTGGPTRLGKLIEAIRLGDELSQVAFAKKIKISRSHLNDIEKGNKKVSPQRAARFAKALGHSEERFVELALQELIDESGLKFKVAVKTAA
jgi:transcriptional regulator with XRE-family HTH domain